MNDPLLNQTWAPPAEKKIEMTTPVVRPTRQKHPAASSRILAVVIAMSEAAASGTRFVLGRYATRRAAARS
jgi:hypothetical protein